MRFFHAILKSGVAEFSLFRIPEVRPGEKPIGSPVAKLHRQIINLLHVATFLVGGLEYVLFSRILGKIIPID